MRETITIQITYDPDENTPDHLVWQIGGLKGVTDMTAHVPYAVIHQDTDQPTAVLPNRAAAEDVARSLGSDYYVAPDFIETDIKYVA